MGHGDPTVVAIVRSVRLPRVVLAACVGAALGMSGAAMQGTLRNALAEPYLLGVSGGAAVGAVIAVAAGASSSVGVPFAAFGGAVVATALVIGVARAAAGGRTDVRLLLMAGVVVGAFANAAIMVAYAVAPPETVRGALWWMMGSVDSADWSRVRWLAAVRDRRAAARCWRGDARSMRWRWVTKPRRRWASTSSGPAAGRFSRRGCWRQRPSRLRDSSGSSASSSRTSCARAGLHRHRSSLPVPRSSARTLVVGADVVARVARPPAELPLGAVTALLGVPFFLWQLRRMGTT